MAGASEKSTLFSGGFASSGVRARQLPDALHAELLFF
jgi:hypothetical protein